MIMKAMVMPRTTSRESRRLTGLGAGAAMVVAKGDGAVAGLVMAILPPLKERWLQLRYAVLVVFAKPSSPFDLARKFAGTLRSARGCCYTPPFREFE
jgi:hypothetical protein